MALTDAILLRSIEYRDADRIVTLLTRDLGKLNGLARNARKSRRRFAGSLEPFSVVRADINRGRGDLATIARADIVRSHPKLLANLAAITFTGHGLELCRKMIPEHEPDERIYQCVDQYLEAVDETPEHARLLRNRFSLRLLAVAGMAPELSHCARCGKVAAEGKAAKYDPHAGSVVCRACGGGAVFLSGAARASAYRSTTRDWLAELPDAGHAWSEADDEVERLVIESVQHHLSGPWSGAGQSPKRPSSPTGRN